MSETKAFEEAVRDMRTADDSESTRLIENFNKSNKELVVLLTKDSSRDKYSSVEVSRMLEALSNELDKLGDDLMSLELRQVEKFESIIDDFDNRYNELKNICLEMQTTLFRAAEKMEDDLFQSISALIVDLMGRLAREELAEDYLDDEAMTLLMDRESCMGVLGISHDMHIGRLLKLEDQARNTETHAYVNLIQGHTNAERTRNRKRVLEIHDFCRTAKITMNALNVTEEDEVEEEA